MWLKKIIADIDVDLDIPNPYKKGDILLLETSGGGISVVKVISPEEVPEHILSAYFDPQFDVACVTIKHYSSHVGFSADSEGLIHCIYWRNLFRNIKEYVENEIDKGYVYPDVILRRVSAPDVQELAEQYPQLIGFDHITEYIPVQMLSVENLYALIIQHYSKSYWYWHIPELDLRSIDNEMFYPLRMFDTPEKTTADLREWVKNAGPEKEFPKLAENIVKAFKLLTPHTSGPYYKEYLRATHQNIHMMFNNRRHSNPHDKYRGITLLFDANLRENTLACKVAVFQNIPDRPSVAIMGTPMFNIREDEFTIQTSEMRKLPYLFITKAYGLVDNLGENWGDNDNNDQPDFTPTDPTGIESLEPDLVYSKNKNVVKTAQQPRQQILNEYHQQYSICNSRVNQIREDHFRASRVETYYESILQDYESREQSKIAWEPLLKWMQSVMKEVRATGDQKFISDFSAEIARLQTELETPEPRPYSSEYENYYDLEVLEWYLEGDKDVNEHIIPLLDQHNIPWNIHKFPTGKRVMTIQIGEPEEKWRRGSGFWVIEQDDQGIHYWKDPEEWINSAFEHSFEYYPETNFSERFWGDVGQGSILYHATPEENVESIQQNGLEARDYTRGLSNRDMGAAVFTLSGENIDDVAMALESYGTTIFEIDLASMKADGYMPEVAQEIPIAEGEMKNALAAGIDWDNYYPDEESDMMPDTIAIFGDIPLKYLRVTK